MNTKGMAEAAFGTPAMRQASVKSPFQVSTYENPTPVVDYSGGYVASKALDTFGNVFADAVTAKYGNKDNEQ